jgi:hypothetical protein
VEVVDRRVLGQADQERLMDLVEDLHLEDMELLTPVVAVVVVVLVLKAKVL